MDDLRSKSSNDLNFIRSPALTIAPHHSEFAAFGVAGLFAGIGGLEEGFRSQGCHTNLLCESDSIAQRVLAARFPDIEISNDIRDVKSLPECDVITAGFPCQDLSQVGKTKGITGANSGLITEVFRLLSKVGAHTRWLVLENVPFMLRLQGGAAIREITCNLERMGWNWAYRTIDSQAFGLPQRRRRVFLIASRTEDPRAPLLGQDHGEPELSVSKRRACGFYWTEGHTGLGWAVGAIPPLKSGSGLAIPSPPAIWLPKRHTFVVPSIENAEQLQGFAPRWTQSAGDVPAGERVRWRLVGNAVSVPVAAWIAARLRNAIEYDDQRDRMMTANERWPNAAWGIDGKRAESSASSWPVKIDGPSLESLLGTEPHLLSHRAAAGFLARLEHSCLRVDADFLSDLQAYVRNAKPRLTASQKKMPKKKEVHSAVSRRMAATRGQNNKAELELRSALHKRGFRYRVHYKVVGESRRSVDIAFPGLRIAVFLDGCFWHGCPIHGTWPKKDAHWWREKIIGNRRRDNDTSRKLKRQGWLVIRIWEHESPDTAANRIARVLRVRKARQA